MFNIASKLHIHFYSFKGLVRLVDIVYIISHIVCRR